MSRRRSIGLAALLTWGAARAEPVRVAVPPSARLVYTRGAGAGRCPDEESLRNTVSARLGYDPFQPDATRTVIATIDREGRGLIAQVISRDEGGRSTGSRRLRSRQNDCAELSSAMALAISIAIDPLHLSRSPPPPPPSPAPPRPVEPEPRRAWLIERIPPPPAPPPPIDPPPEPGRIALRAGVGAIAALGAIPGFSLGATAFVGLHWRSLSVDVEGRGDFPVSGVPAAGGAVKASLLLATLVPCLNLGWEDHARGGHRAFFLGCLLVAAGGLKGAGEEIAQPRRDTTFYAAAGARLAVEIPIHRWLSDPPPGRRRPIERALLVRIHLDLLASITRTSLQVNGSDAWTTPPVSGAAGAGLAGHF